MKFNVENEIFSEKANFSSNYKLLSKIVFMIFHYFLCERYKNIMTEAGS